MAFIDYYKILGVNKDIPQKDVKKAYLKRAKQFHPDLHPDDPKAKAKFQALTEAYDVIGDPDKRRKYDQYGEQWKNAEAFGGGGAYGSGHAPFDGFDFSSFGGGGGFSSFFENLFGGGAGRARSHFGGGFAGDHGMDTGDLEAEIAVDLYTAMLGGEVLVQLGDGTKVKLKVKPETQNGTKVRLRGKGRSRRDGTSGDMIVTFTVKLPSGLSERQRQLLREMQSAG